MNYFESLPTLGTRVLNVAILTDVLATFKPDASVTEIRDETVLFNTLTISFDLTDLLADHTIENGSNYRIRQLEDFRFSEIVSNLRSEIPYLGQEARVAVAFNLAAQPLFRQVGTLCHAICYLLDQFKRSGKPAIVTIMSLGRVTATGHADVEQVHGQLYRLLYEERLGTYGAHPLTLCISWFIGDPADSVGGYELVHDLLSQYALAPLIVYSANHGVPLVGKIGKVGSFAHSSNHRPALADNSGSSWRSPVLISGGVLSLRPLKEDRDTHLMTGSDKFLVREYYLPAFIPYIATVLTDGTETLALVGRDVGDRYLTRNTDLVFAGSPNVTGIPGQGLWLGVTVESDRIRYAPVDLHEHPNSAPSGGSFVPGLLVCVLLQSLKYSMREWLGKHVSSEDLKGYIQRELDNLSTTFRSNISAINRNKIFQSSKVNVVSHGRSHRVDIRVQLRDEFANREYCVRFNY